ncbi:Stress activated transcription factor [Trichinella spiralis]|uniref:Stress activated transcription factor n=1 Tax=Trichinella spiralis TaxID=6334 RepID=A0ABR3KDG2_TRISP
MHNCEANCIGFFVRLRHRRDLAPSRCGRRIVVMLWSPSVHLPAAVTDCHDPLDMDGSIICLLISSTGVLDSYIARLVSCVSMEADKIYKAPMLISPQLARSLHSFAFFLRYTSFVHDEFVTRLRCN